MQTHTTEELAQDIFAHLLIQWLQNVGFKAITANTTDGPRTSVSTVLLDDRCTKSWCVRKRSIFIASGQFDEPGVRRARNLFRGGLFGPETVLQVSETGIENSRVEQGTAELLEDTNIFKGMWWLIWDVNLKGSIARTAKILEENPNLKDCLLAREDHFVPLRPEGFTRENALCVMKSHIL
jgi:hypothetical protein